MRCPKCQTILSWEDGAYCQSCMKEGEEMNKRSPKMKDKLSLEEKIAQLFHSTYEGLASFYGYETRPETKTSWDKLPSQNKNLMIATVKEILPQIKSMLQPVPEEKMDEFVERWIDKIGYRFVAIPSELLKEMLEEYHAIPRK